MGKLSDRRKERKIRYLKEEVKIYKEAGFEGEDISRIMLYQQLADAVSLLSDYHLVSQLILLLLFIIVFWIIL